ncbi:hypothetical protein M405DRAFT_870508 [Rhizopogon salebrosus TDB-379]|nr:hypothetical protein M405DRAFT_870508 [Rhizopogon salebrosus TDB-379]
MNEERWTWDEDDLDGTNTECIRANVFERHAMESNTIRAKSSADVMKYNRLIDIQVGRMGNVPQRSMPSIGPSNVLET